MALLTVEKRKEYFKTLGLGEYNEKNIRVVQKRYMLRKKDVDGVYGEDTDNLLRHLMNCHLYLNPDNFRPEEFRCGCNGRHCCGYPTYMKPVELQAVQAIRSHYERPMIITCGVRCPAYNREVGGIPNSEHKKGLAVDYCIRGVTDTLANRKANIGWISTLPDHHYTYGNGIFIETANGKTVKGSVSAPGMGNAMHTDCKEAPSPYDENGKLICDGVGGAATVKETQRFFGTPQDGILSGQNKSLKKYYPALTAVEFGKGGSVCVKKLQKWVGVTQDGVVGEKTVKAWQKKIGVTADGVFGANSVKAWQKYLNEHDKATYPAVKPAVTLTKPQKAVEYAKKIAADNSYHYVVWKSNDAKTKQCPICHNFGNGKYKGFNCIRLTFACWRHGGDIPCKCEGALISNAIGDKMYKASDAEMLKLAQNAIGCKDIVVYRNKNGFGDSKLQIGDACLHFEKGVYKHIYLYAGNGMMVDSGNWKNTADQIKVRKRQSCQIIVRYVGK